MRHRAGSQRRSVAAGLVLAVGLYVGAAVVPGSAAGADADIADPLDVPSGPGLMPEDYVGLAIEERMQRAAASHRERGFPELPVLAWALLDASRGSTATDLIERVRELAPNDPGVRFELARRTGSPLDAWAAVVGAVTHLPGLLWLAGWVGASVGLGLLLAGAVVISVQFLRTLALHGHAFGHVARVAEPAAWPGMLVTAALLALLCATGAGPALLLAVAGAIALVRLHAREAVSVALAITLIGLALGPPLDFWTRIVSLPAADPALLAAWRVERSQPLPGDVERLQSSLARDPERPLVRLALATGWKREGDLERAAAALRDFPEAVPRSLRARAWNQHGIIELAGGRVSAAADAFEQARKLEESAAVLYNLSQAHGRSLRLVDQTAVFAAARDLDPDLVTRYNSIHGANVHHYAIDPASPLSAYLGRALTPSGEASELARSMRRALLGPGTPSWGWMLLPGLAALGTASRRRGIRRCVRCMRAVCEHCDAAPPRDAVCTRCARLAGQDAKADARMRRRQLALDRGRQAVLNRLLEAVGLLLPGARGLFDGHPLAAALQLLALALGPAALWAALWIPVPATLGGAAHVVPVVAAVALVAPLYVLGWGKLLLRRRVSGGGAT